MKDPTEEAAERITDIINKEWDKMSELSRIMLKFGEDNNISPTAFVAACFITIRSCSTPAKMPEELLQVLDGFAKKVSADAFMRMKPLIDELLAMETKGKIVN
jgi:hypothetical protein